MTGDAMDLVHTIHQAVTWPLRVVLRALLWALETPGRTALLGVGLLAAAGLLSRG